MPRQYQRRANQRVGVQSSDVNVGTGLYAPDNVVARSGAADQAAVLSDALGFAQKLATQQIKRVQDKGILLGTKAALEGRQLTDDETKRDSVFYGYTKVRTERAAVEMKNAVRTAYQQSTNKGDPAALAAELDEVYKQHFGGLDVESDLDRAMLGIAGPAYQEALAEVDAAHAEESAIQLQNDMEDDATIIARERYADNGVVDWQQMNDDLMAAGVAPSRVNDIIASTARDIAERNGDVSVLDTLPKLWASGAAGPAAIAKYQDGLRNSRVASENRRRYLDDKAQVDGDKAHAEWEENADTAIMANILEGNATSVPAMLQGLVAAGYDASSARTWLNFARSYQNQSLSDVPVNWDAVATLEQSIMNNDATLDDINAAIRDGHLGGGEDLANLTVRLNRNLRSVQSAVRNDPTFVTRRDELSADYTANVDYERAIPGIAQRRAEAMRRWADLIFGEEKLSADEATARVKQELPPQGKEYWDEQFANANRMDPATAVQRWRSAAGSPADILNSLPPGGNLLDLLEDGTIDDKEYEELKRIR